MRIEFNMTSKGEEFYPTQDNRVLTLKKKINFIKFNINSLVFCNFFSQCLLLLCMLPVVFYLLLVMFLKIFCLISFLYYNCFLCTILTKAPFKQLTTLTYLQF